MRPHAEVRRICQIINVVRGRKKGKPSCKWDQSGLEADFLRMHEPITNLLSETLEDSSASRPIRNTLAAAPNGKTLILPPVIAPTANRDEKDGVGRSRHVCFRRDY